MKSACPNSARTRWTGCAAATKKSELDAAQRAEILDLAMRELSPADRVVITMQEIEGRSVKEISEAIGSSGVAVRVRALRARAKLKQRAGKTGETMNEQKLKKLFEAARNETAPAPPRILRRTCCALIRREKQTPLRETFPFSTS